MVDDSLDGLLGAAIFLGVAMPFTYGMIKMTERNVNELIKQGKKQGGRKTKRRRDPYAGYNFPKFKF